MFLRPESHYRSISGQIILQLVLICFFSLLSQCSPVYGQVWHGKVIKVIDGDSLLIKKGKVVYEIRLYGIDAPEYGQVYGKIAKKHLTKLILKKIVSVEQKDIDKYNRIVALVHSQGILVNRELVKAGMAWVYRKYCRETELCTELKALERTAGKKKIGLWRLENPVSPWRWKRR